MPFIGKKIVQNQVTGTDIVDGTLVAADIADGAVSTAKLAADAVDGTKLADNAVNSEHYTDGSIDTAHVADANITTAKLADNAVTTAKITDANITTAKIADTAITTAKITDANITTAKVADDAVTQAKIAADAVGTNELANDVAISTSGAISTSNNLIVRNSSTTGATINVGTTSTSVANGGYIGGILFDASTANSAVARIQALSNGQTDAGNTGTGADFSFECRENNQSFTEKARIHGAGQFTVNNQPYFMGGRQGTTGSITGYTQGTGNVMICNISQDNIGGHYNTSNGQFTCPVTGQYAVNFFGFMHSGSGNPTSNYSIQIMINASIMQIPYFAHVQGNNTYMSASTIIRCAATNVITIKLMNGFWYSNDWRYFHNSFYLLG